MDTPEDGNIVHIGTHRSEVEFLRAVERTDEDTAHLKSILLNVRESSIGLLESIDLKGSSYQRVMRGINGVRFTWKGDTSEPEIYEEVDEAIAPIFDTYNDCFTADVTITEGRIRTTLEHLCVSFEPLDEDDFKEMRVVAAMWEGAKSFAEVIFLNLENELDSRRVNKKHTRDWLGKIATLSEDSISPYVNREFRDAYKAHLLEPRIVHSLALQIFEQETQKLTISVGNEAPIDTFKREIQLTAQNQINEGRPNLELLAIAVPMTKDELLALLRGC